MNHERTLFHAKRIDSLIRGLCRDLNVECGAVVTIDTCQRLKQAVGKLAMAADHLEKCKAILEERLGSQ